jgi:hypothetical protein
VFRFISFHVNEMILFRLLNETDNKIVFYFVVSNETVNETIFFVSLNKYMKFCVSFQFIINETVDETIFYFVLLQT